MGITLSFIKLISGHVSMRCLYLSILLCLLCLSERIVRKGDIISRGGSLGLSLVKVKSSQGGAPITGGADSSGGESPNPSGRGNGHKGTNSDDSSDGDPNSDRDDSKPDNRDPGRVGTNHPDDNGEDEPELAGIFEDNNSSDTDDDDDDNSSTNLSYLGRRNPTPPRPSKWRAIKGKNRGGS